MASFFQCSTSNGQAQSFMFYPSMKQTSLAFGNNSLSDGFLKFKKLKRIGVTCSASEVGQSVLQAAAISGGLAAGTFGALRIFVYLRLEYITTAMLTRFVPRGGSYVVDISESVGRNLYYYPKDVLQVTVPNFKGNKQILESQAIEAAIPINIKSADLIDFKLFPESADAVVSVDALCKLSKEDLKLALKQLARALKHDQPFIFVESSLAPEGPLRMAQLAWWTFLDFFGKGSRFKGDLAHIIRDSPDLEVLQIDLATTYQDPHIVGVAIKAGKEKETKKRSAPKRKQK